MADHSKPTITSIYSNFVTELDSRFDDLAVGLDPAVTTATNIPANSVRWSSVSNKWQKYDGSNWADLSTVFDIQTKNVPAGNISATTTQAAINELDIEKQPIDATLTALAGVATAADKVLYFTGVDTASSMTVTATARTLLDDTTVEAMRTTLGVPATDHTHAVATTSVAGLLSSTDKTKLNGIATGATANATDALLRDRSTHTGAQAISTVTGLQAALDANLASPTFTGQVIMPEGTSSVPGLAFANDGAPDTGLYHISEGVFGVTCNTQPVMKFSSSAVTFLRSVDLKGAGSTYTAQLGYSNDIFTLASNNQTVLTVAGDGIAKFAKLGNATKFANGGGFAGGEIRLEKPLAGSTLSGDVVIDVSGGDLRFFDAVSSKGVYVRLPDQQAYPGTRLLTALDLGNLAPLASPSFTGTPLAPTAAAGTNTTQVATTAFVTTAVTNSAPTASQVLSATAGASTGGIGTYAFLCGPADTTYAPGAIVAGSSLKYAGARTDTGGSPYTSYVVGSTATSGTWRCMGYVPSGSYSGASLWLRIS